MNKSIEVRGQFHLSRYSSFIFVICDLFTRCPAFLVLDGFIIIFWGPFSLRGYFLVMHIIDFLLNVEFFVCF